MAHIQKQLASQLLNGASLTVRGLVKVAHHCQERERLIKDTADPSVLTEIGHMEIAVGEVLAGRQCMVR